MSEYISGSYLSLLKWANYYVVTISICIVFSTARVGQLTGNGDVGCLHDVFLEDW